MDVYDAIVCGSGVTGGWAAKELTERGLKVLLIERGKNIRHRVDYATENLPPWELNYRGYSDPEILQTSKSIQKHAKLDEWVEGMYVDDNKEKYLTTEESKFRWLRGYHLGGRSLMWGRHCYRMSPLNFKSNEIDGHGIPWPVSYEDIKPWYDYVEKFIGVNGTNESLETLPDGIYQPTMGFNKAESLFAEKVRQKFSDRRVIPGRTANLTESIGDRIKCQNRSQCARGCSFGAYFSTQSSTLPAAMATGRLTVITDSIVKSVVYDEKLRRATGVKVKNTITGKEDIKYSKIIFLCTGSINSVSILLRSISASHPTGLGNSSGLLGKYVLDHGFGTPVISTVPGIDDWYYHGRKPNGLIIPRFINVSSNDTDFLRGYSFQGFSGRESWNRGFTMEGLGENFKNELRTPGNWIIGFHVSVEMIPRKENSIGLKVNERDENDLPLTTIDVRWSSNEIKAAKHSHREIREMLGILGGHISGDNNELEPPGTSIHEMGGACMGNDPMNSVTNKFNQLHDAPNVYVTDGAFMNSSGDRNPSLTYMAFTARAAAHAADSLKYT